MALGMILFFANLAHATILSKFELKASFWQLGVHPLKKHKTAFTILRQHFQWTIMPFKLKTTLSLFQKAMTRIFSPLEKHALIYVDNILLFSNIDAKHMKFLQQFHQIIQQHDIMLSEKKMIIGESSIEFMGMKIEKGTYVPQSHIAVHLTDLPDKDLTTKQFQQFLGIINYVS